MNELLGESFTRYASLNATAGKIILRSTELMALKKNAMTLVREVSSSCCVRDIRSCSL
jgi:hypothetical protein